MKLIKLLLVTTLFLSLFFSYPQTVTAKSMDDVHPVLSSQIQVEPRATLKDWRYKSVNGKIYRRLYNYTLQRWEGEWELCP